MTPVVLDNIVFAIQRFGGISTVWGELLRRACADEELAVQVLDYPNDNMVRKELFVPSEQIITMPYRRAERYRLPDWQPTTPAVFHSSYFRYCSHPLTKNITTVHDLTYHYYRHGLAKAVHLWEEQRALRHSEAVICVSENTKRDLLSIYPWLEEERVHVVYNGVSDAFYPDSEIVKQGYLLYVGNRSVAYKRFDVAVEVARRTGLELVALGGALTEKEKQWLDATIPNKYRIISGASMSEFNKYYNEALCLLYPSEYEGFGLPVIEAQKAGCPVIAQESSSIPEVIGGGWMVSAHSVHMVDEMVEIVKQIQSRAMEADIEKGICHAAQFSWDKTYEQTKAIYTKIINQ